MIHLSVFADEIAADLDEQLSTMQELDIHSLDLRGAWGIPVLQLDDQRVEQIEAALAQHNMHIAAIGSPIGKAPIDAPFEQQLNQLERAIMLAQRFNTPYIRIFSYYPPAQTTSATWPDDYRSIILERLGELTARAQAAQIILTHENEKDIYGDTIARCVDLLDAVNDPHFRAVFDPANFIQCEQTPYPDAFEAILPWLSYVHVKDATAEGSVVAAGKGVSQWPTIVQRLHAAGYDGVFSLEPHLKAAGQFGGFSGAQLVGHAARSFQKLLTNAGWEHA